MNLFHTLDNSTLNFSKKDQAEAIDALESGHVVYLPSLAFTLKSVEEKLLDPDILAPQTKNVSYQPLLDEVKGAKVNDVVLEGLMKRYMGFGKDLVDALLPHYSSTITVANTSYRPAQIQGRASSYRKDDTRLHVDAFPSNPNQGKRILRVFSNINPNHEPRHWRLGEPFTDVRDRFLPQIRAPLPLVHRMMNALGITKSLRSDYDHYMLQIHNRMKADIDYQNSANQIEFDFPPGGTWMVYTDSVSHAAMRGQFVMEQTFSLPVEGMFDPEKSPLRLLESALGRKLVGA